MSAPILPISPASIVSAIQPAGAAAGSGAFQNVFASAVQQVDSLGKAASSSVERFLAGDGEELHTAVMATNRAELAFDLFMQTRNKVVSAYQEVMKMQI
ncbi:MAG: flagellar hook-basal body complex protein FliE [Candidatus Sulfopaludibacter sp.]|nr:flagellar hook-basal body complex protein FliE [Candidatus Sulfopaludibacter sp.]